MPHDDLRADERERALISHVARSNAREAHAEAVAAKLVEVVCEQNLYLAIADSRLERVQRQRNIAWNERDAARAEVATLTDALDIAKDERYAARVEQARAAQRLRDLRAKVDSLPRIAAVSRGTGSYVPCVQLGDVLALLDEVQP
jgi:hypothetical protein